MLLVNPVSGGRKKEPILEDIRAFCDHYGIELSVFKTTGEKDIEKFGERLEAFSPDRVAAAGGDGTVQLAATALMQRDIPLGIIPLGSANGMARELKIPKDPMEALRDMLLSQRFAPLDLLRVNQEHVCMHIGDVGLNAGIVKAFSEDKSRGLTTYAKHFIEQLRATEPFSFTLRCNGREIEREGVMLALCNARTFGTGLPMNSESNPFDGKFELVVVETVRPDSILKAGLSKLVEAFADNFNNEVIAATEALITLDKPRLLQLDGEIVGKFDRLEVEIIPAAVPLIVTAETRYWKKDLRGEQK